ncbi:hypothetical protein BDW62DRAFT_202844 [Aspergillus aurantiobrunneus]
MRFPLNYMAILAILLGALLQAAARAVPPAGPQREARAIILGKPPAKGPTTGGGTHADTPTGHGTSHGTPNSYVPGASSAGTHPGKGGTTCKRTDGCNTDIDSVPLNTFQIDREHRTTASAWVDWTPPKAVIDSNQRQFRQNLRKVALTIYDRLWKEESNIIDNSGTNLVAALHVPGEGVFLSTIPREGAASALLQDWRTRAPRLYEATDGNRVAQSGHQNSLHAEDGAVHQWEVRMASEGRHGSPGLPEGSQILVFGRRGSYDSVPDVVPPCSGSSGRHPSCSQVLHRLGIRPVTREEAAK